jgi:hypothetical protein
MGDDEEYTWLDITMGIIVLVSGPAMYLLAFWQHR